MENLHDIYFHAATIRDVVQSDRALLVSVEGANVNAQRCNVAVEFTGIRTLTRDTLDTEYFLKEQPDGRL